MLKPERAGFILACVMDLASRRGMGWSMSDRIKADLVTDALRSAYGRRKPCAGVIMHSDRGSQYASEKHHLNSSRRIEWFNR